MRKQAEEAKRAQENALQSRAAALASMPESLISKEEMAQLATALAAPAGAAPGAPVPGAAPASASPKNVVPGAVPGAGAGGGPGGGRRAPVAPPTGLGKSLLDFEV